MIGSPKQTDQTENIFMTPHYVCRFVSEEKLQTVFHFLHIFTLFCPAVTTNIHSVLIQPIKGCRLERLIASRRPVVIRAVTKVQRMRTGQRSKMICPLSLRWRAASNGRHPEDSDRKLHKSEPSLRLQSYQQPSHGG